jgi:NAD(P)-dependent dehydrogenase (short-subunit alcohol dehydrogenase family)
MLDGKVYIVAGGGRGIGEAVAVELGRGGAIVVVNDLGSTVTGEGESEEPARETVEAVRDAGGDGTTHFGDITDLEYTERLVEETVAEYGRVDGVVNFAGSVRDSISYKMSGDEWDDVIDVHLRGHFSLLRAVAAHWRERARDGLDAERSFLAVASRSALGSPGQANYSAAKAGILGLVRTTARELSRYDIRVNALMPTAYTRMIENIPEEKRPFTREEMPPENIGPVVAFLLSDEAEGITGTTVRAAGDTVGVVSDPEIVRLGLNQDGWTIEELAERFRSDVAEGVDLDRSGLAF